MRAVGSKPLSSKIIDWCVLYCPILTLNKPVLNSTVYVDAVRWEAGGRSQSGVHQHTQNSPTHCCLPEDRVSAWKRFPTSSAHHPGPLELHWNAAFELDPALEPNYHGKHCTLSVMRGIYLLGNSPRRVRLCYG
jgi:hypothetical protein